MDTLLELKSITAWIRTVQQMHKIKSSELAHTKQYR